MIIEIKGLPEGQKIKHINVDITFDDNGEIGSVTENFQHACEETQPVEIDTREAFTNQDRPKAEIPPEMTNLEI